MGYWTHAAEAWYQRRMKAIEAGDAVPYTSSEWRSHLRHTKTDSRDFLSRIEYLSEKRL